MKLRKSYYISTFLYAIIGLFGFYFLLISISKADYFLAVISALVAFVSFDNVFCSSRKRRYSVR